MTENPETFYIVWNPKGPHAPRQKHPAASIAEAEAERLAIEYPGQTFFVMQATMSARTTKPIEVVRFDTDNIPF